MKKLELSILGVRSSAEKSQTYAILLKEKDGTRKMPITIGAFEAQAIVVILENIRPGRPLTHDLFYNFINTFNIVVLEVVIYKFEEGVFYAKLVCMKDGEQVDIDARTSDSIALAIRIGCPVYTYEDILEVTDSLMESGVAGIRSIAPEKIENEHQVSAANDLVLMSEADLEAMLEEALANEDYNLAIAIRDELNKRK